MWHKESSLNSCSHVYFLKDVDGALHAGTDRGVFVLGGDGVWVPDKTFPQATFDVLQGNWGELCARRRLTTEIRKLGLADTLSSGMWTGGS